MFLLFLILIGIVIFIVVISHSSSDKPYEPLPPIISNSDTVNFSSNTDASDDLRKDFDVDTFLKNLDEEVLGRQEECNIEIKIDAEFTDPQKIENSMKYYEEYTRNSSNPKWHRTDAEKDLRSDFSFKHRSEIEKYEKQAKAHLAFDKTLDIYSRINICKNALSALYKFKDYCYRYPGGIIYFQDMWEHCHNSRNECFSRITQLEELLAELIENKEDFLYRESRLPTLREDIIEYITTHDNVIQKNIYSEFGMILKPDIQEELRALERERLITRTKKGNSYLLAIK